MNKKTLILFDLNKTIIHNVRAGRNENSTNKIYIRPHLKYLLQELKKYNLDIGIWTFSSVDIAKNILDFLEESLQIKFDLMKVSSSSIKKKDLNVIKMEYKYENVVLIEDNEEKCVEGQNYIIIKRFISDFKNLDRELIRVYNIIFHKIKGGKL